MKGALRGLYKRGKIWWYRWGVDGRGYHQSLKTQNEDEAIAKALAIRRTPELVKSDEWKKDVRSFIRHKVSLREFREGQSSKIREDKLVSIGQEIGISTVAQLDTERIQTWYDAMRVAPSTRQTYLNYLSSFCAWLVEKRMLRENPCTRVQRGKIHRAGRKSFLEPEDVDKLIAAVDDRVVAISGEAKGLSNDELKFILLCGFDAGLRTEEIIEAQPHWFDLRRGLLHVQATENWIPKDNEARTIPLTQRFQEFLSTFLRREDKYVLKPSATKSAWRYRYDFRRPFKKFVAAAGYPTLTRHDMRRTFASLRVSAGVSIYKVARWLGDGVAVVERSYGHLIPLDSDIERDR
jgi:integrase